MPKFLNDDRDARSAKLLQERQREMGLTMDSLAEVIEMLPVTSPRFINCVQPDVRNDDGSLVATRVVRGTPALCLGGFDLIRRMQNGRDEYSPTALAEHLRRYADFAGIIELDGEHDERRPTLWQTSVSSPRTSIAILMATMERVVDLSVVYNNFRPGPVPFWYLIGCSPWFKSLNNPSMLAMHLADQRFFQSIDLDVECDALNLDIYRTGAAWEDRWWSEVVMSMVRENRMIWPGKPIRLSIAAKVIDGSRLLPPATFKNDLDLARRALLQPGGHHADAIEWWEPNRPGQDHPFDVGWAHVEVWNQYVNEHERAGTNGTPATPTPTERAASASA
jgi:hypothetical protein